MEMGSKFPRIRSGNGRSESVKVGRKREEQEEEEEGGKRPSALDIASAGGLGRLCGWPSSRIVRVSRASGGKDRHSKVWTSKGLRDRRVRLSVNTAIQFYDLQDRLGYDQPSKAVEWLLKAAAASIDELPSINTSFPSTPGQQASDEMEMEGELYQHQQQQQGNNFSKSACSSTSETSKGSGLSLSRCESRIKARERARGRAAEKDKEKEKEHQNVSQSSFTDLLTGGNGNANTPSSPNRDSPASRQWCSAPMDYFAAGLLGLSSTPSSSPNLLPQIHPPPLYNVPGEHYSFLPDHLSSNSNANANNLNFTTSPGYTGFNRGTLQSNSPSSSLLPHQLHSFSSSSPLFTATAPPVEDHHHFLPGFDARLQLCYGDGGSHSDQKGKVKN